MIIARNHNLFKANMKPHLSQIFYSTNELQSSEVFCEYFIFHLRSLMIKEKQLAVKNKNISQQFTILEDLMCIQILLIKS